MGNTQSLAPVLDNKCLDPNNTETIKDFCYPDDGNLTAGSSNDFCSYRGGTYDATGVTGANRVPGQLFGYGNPEWGYASRGTQCYYDDDNVATGHEMTGSDCVSGGGCGIYFGSGLNCTKNSNFGDPLSCCLRDFQCSSDTTLTGKACFSDDLTNSTCPSDFRATDTPGCLSIINQLCLGNIPSAITGGTGISDFTQLWTDSTDPVNNQPWVVTNLPPGSIYQTNSDALALCKLNKDGTLSNTTLTNSPLPSSTCPTHTWSLGATGAPDTYFPQPTPYQFGQLPPCQQLFWRTLYGNQPRFKNNIWTTRGQDSSFATEATSIPPQLAACGTIPFAGAPTPGGVENAEYLLSSAVNKFINEGGSITASITTVKDAPFLSWLFSVCSAYPNLCSSGPGSSGVGNKFLDNVCANVTAEDIQTNPEVLKWCGCYMPDSQYTTYGNITDSVISRECTPFCNASGVIPSFDPATGNVKFCQQSLCVIDDVTLTIAKSRVNGPITFNNICTSCSPDSGNGVNSNLVSNSNNGNVVTDSQSNSTINASVSCQCIINNFNLTTIGTTIDGGINISQACNGNAKCYKTETVNGVEQTQEVDCHSNNLSGNNVLLEEERKLMKKAEDTGNYWIILIIIITILVIILLWILLGPRGVPTKDLTFTKTTNIQLPPQINPPLMKPTMPYKPMSESFVKSKPKYF